MGKEKRFVRVYVESTALEDSAVWVDRETGVNYLWHSAGQAGGLTPLLDRTGKPVVTTVLED
ncbi:DUF6440 family protein [uncultured Oscillibacter sp.]|uniref:DUF6440 family protein n=1 Tax=uncultured Oscillibacter sp. TaxID=876091 RepID=UPI0025E5C61B|nr:DUF6440 family protein [uncultured Oscillibacter sp.]